MAVTLDAQFRKLTVIQEDVEDEGLPSLPCEGLRLESMEFRKELGEGAFGNVKRYTYEGTDFAIKIILDNPDARRIAFDELAILRRLHEKPSHENVVRYYGQIRSATQIIFGLELVSGGDLFDAINSATAPLSKKEIKGITYKIALGLEHLHRYGIIHRDVKPENILLDGKNPKITDFGFAVAVDTASGVDTQLAEVPGFVGTPDYCSPEIISRGVSCQKSDFWSLGVILYIILKTAVKIRF